MPINNEQVKKRNRQMVILLVAAVAGAMIIFGGGAYLFTRIFTGHVKTTEDYATVELASSTYSDDLTLTGSVQSASSSTVTAKVDGTVSVLSVAEGDKVKKGDKLFIMENDTISSAVTTALNALTAAQDDEEEAKTNLENAQSKVASAQASLNKAKSSLEKAQTQAEKKQEENPEYEFDSSPYDDAVELAQKSLDDANSSVELMQTAYEKTQSKTSEAQDVYDKAKKDEDNLTVTSPADGTVSNLSIEVGSSSAAFNVDGAMKIVDMDSITCVVQVPESQVGNVSKGQSATVTCEGLDKSFTAIVSRVSDTPSKTSTSGSAASSSKDTAEASSSSSEDASSSTDAQAASDTSADDAQDATQTTGTTYDVTLTLDSSSKKIKIGMSATASITIQDYGTVYYVPASAVAKNNSGLYVEAVSDEKTTKQYSVTQIATAEDGQLVIQGASLMPGMSIRTDLS